MRGRLSCPVDMNKSPSMKVLLAIVTVLTLWSLILCFTYISRVRQYRALQMEAARLNNKQQGITMLVNEAVEYGKTHPAIEPILDSIRARATAPATSAPPAAASAPKPATK